MKIPLTLVVVSLAGALVLACEHPQDRYVATPGEPVVVNRPIGDTNAQPPSSSADAPIVDRLSTARCDREQFCDNVGGGKKYAARQVCMDQLRGSIGNDLNAYQCPRGLEECGAHPVEAITRMDRCRSGAMCLK
jgi:hypothetical protein